METGDARRVTCFCFPPGALGRFTLALTLSVEEEQEVKKTRPEIFFRASLVYLCICLLVYFYK